MPWNTIKERPILALAPMADVTDPAFRSIIARYGKPHILWTEFVSADGLYHTREKAHMPDEENPLMRALQFEAHERPIIAQLFSANPAMMEYAAELVQKLGFDGVDINMGCPDRSVEKQGAGAALMKNPPLARSLIRAAKRGANTIPVSVKTRIGYAKNDLTSWLPELLAEEPAAVTIHARTRNELSDVPARFEHVREAVELRTAHGSPAYILGNGDVRSVRHAHELSESTGAEGIMLGRAIFGNPWLFSDVLPTHRERLLVLTEHVRAFERTCAHKSFAVMKKHFKSYIHGFDGARDLREELMRADSPDGVCDILMKALDTMPDTEPAQNKVY